MKFNLFLSKRGEDQKAPEAILIPLAGLLVVLFVIFLPLLSIAKDVKEKTVFERNFLALDLGTITTAITNSPGNLYIDYPKDTFWFFYNFEKNNVKVIDKANVVSVESNYPFIEDKGNSYSYAELEPDFGDKSASKENLVEAVKIRLVKRGNLITFEEQEELEPTIVKLSCPSIDTKADIKEKRIFIQKGENEVATEFASSLIKKFAERGIEASAEEGGDINVLLDTGPEDSSKYLEIFINSGSEGEIEEKNRKLACLILKRMLSDTELLEMVRETSVSLTDSFKDEDKDKIIFLLQMSGLSIDDEISINAVVSSIYDSILEYYG